MQTVLLFTLDATDALKLVGVTSLSACTCTTIFYNPNAVGLHTSVLQKKAKKDSLNMGIDDGIPFWLATKNVVVLRNNIKIVQASVWE